MMNNEKTLRIEALARLMKDGDAFERQEAYEKLFSEVTFFVNSLVTKYFPTYQGTHYEDMCQEGYLALCECLPYFDYNKSKSLTTYVKPFIMGRIAEYISNQVHNRSTYYAHIIRAIEKAEKELKLEGLAVTDEAIHNLTGLSINIITTAHNMRIKTQQCSLDEAMQSASSIPTPEDHMMQSEKNKALHDALSLLSDIERLEIECFYGFKDGGRGAEYAQKVMGLDFRGQNTIHTRAIRKLRKNKTLADILGI